MNFGPRDELRMELKKHPERKGLNLEFQELLFRKDSRRVKTMKLYNMEKQQKDTKANIELDLDLFQMEHDHHSSLLS